MGVVRGIIVISGNYPGGVGSCPRCKLCGSNCPGHYPRVIYPRWEFSGSNCPGSVVIGKIVWRVIFSGVIIPGESFLGVNCPRWELSRGQLSLVGIVRGGGGGGICPNRELPGGSYLGENSVTKNRKPENCSCRLCKCYINNKGFVCERIKKFGIFW